MNYRREIIVSARFIGFHSWKDAPADVEYLRSLHRHLFHVRIGCAVEHGDRQLEFFQIQKLLQKNLDWIGKRDASCEEFAQAILEHIPQAHWAEVFEDNENGARVSKVEKDNNEHNRYYRLSEPGVQQG